MAEKIRLEKQDKIAVVTIQNPPVNALSQAVLKELEETIDEVAKDASVKVLVLTGAGTVFVAGADIKEFTAIQTPEDGKRAAEKGQRIFRKLELLEKPVIAAINGVCLGGGMELAMACHLRFCSDRARLGQPEIQLGIIPGFGGTQRLPRLVNPGKALEWILSGEAISPKDALAAGLVNHVLPDADLLRHTLGFAKRLSEKSAIALKAALSAVRASRQDLDEGMQAELEAFGGCCASQDMKEGVQAFLEKRQPKFQDR